MVWNRRSSGHDLTVFAIKLIILFLPCVLAACATATQPQQTAPPPPATAQQPPQAAPESDATYHFMMGHQAELAQDLDTALKEYQAALKADPTSQEVKSRLAALHFALGDMTQAVQYAEDVGQGTGHEPQLLTQMAGILASAGKPETAIELLDKAIAINPERGESYFPKSLILLNQKRIAESEQVAKKGLQYAADSPIGYYYLGRISIEAGNMEQALSSFDRAISVNPSFEPAYLAQASVHESRQEKDKAIAVLKLYLHQVNPRNREVRQHLIQLYIATKDYAGGLAELETMLEDNPGDLDAQLRMALIYGEKKEFSKAIAQLTDILKVKPAELKVRDYLGYLYEETKDLPKAMETYRYNLHLDPRFADSHIHLGVLLYRLKQFPEAVTHLDEAVQLMPKQPEPHIVLGLAYLQSEQFEKASQAFQEGIRHNPKNADLHFNLGTAYDKLNRFDDVERAMETALSLDPHHADALNYLGYSYAERDMKIDQALSLTKRAVALKPENGYYVDSLGWAFYKSGLLSEALTEIKRAVSLVGDDPVIYEHLGEVYMKQHKMTDARDAWLHSLELDPSNEKLLQRFREQGMANPAYEDRIQQAKRRVSEKAQSPQTTPQTHPD
ncbi:MAG: tetratricopeptide repeat protein [Nitrospira sp.]|nr:tetratricopeptide repeat protein [Nitrospira sp.]MDH5348407.1 tetratricopeptide repeat protein [Nitrospira sp.]